MHVSNWLHKAVNTSGHFRNIMIKLPKKTPTFYSFGRLRLLGFVRFGGSGDGRWDSQRSFLALFRGAYAMPRAKTMSIAWKARTRTNLNYLFGPKY